MIRRSIELTLVMAALIVWAAPVLAKGVEEPWSEIEARYEVSPHQALYRGRPRPFRRISQRTRQRGQRGARPFPGSCNFAG